MFNLFNIFYLSWLCLRDTILGLLNKLLDFLYWFLTFLIDVLFQVNCIKQFIDFHKLFGLYRTLIACILNRVQFTTLLIHMKLKWKAMFLANAKLLHHWGQCYFSERVLSVDSFFMNFFSTKITKNCFAITTVDRSRIFITSFAHLIFEILAFTN